MNSRLHVLVYAVTVLLIPACVKHLTVSVRNPPTEKDSYAINAKVTKTGEMPSLQYFFTVDPNSEKKIDQDFKEDSTVTLQARLNSYIVWESPQFVMNRDITDSLTLNTSGVRKLDAASEFQGLATADKQLSKLVAPRGYQPVNNVFEADFGAFVKRPIPNGEWMAVAGPAVYDGKKDQNWYQSQTGSTAVEVTKSALLNKTTTATAQAQLGIFHAKAGYTDTDLYQYGLEINVVSLEHTDTFYTAKAKLALKDTPEARSANAAIDDCIKNRDACQVAFVRGLLIFKNYRVSYKKSTRIAVDTKLDVSAIVDLSGAYQLDSSALDEDLYKDFVGGFWYEGPDLTSELKPGKDGKVAIGHLKLDAKNQKDALRKLGVMRWGSVMFTGDKAYKATALTSEAVNKQLSALLEDPDKEVGSTHLRDRTLDTYLLKSASK